MKHLSRRTFVRLMGLGAGSAFVSVGVSACGSGAEDGPSDAGATDTGGRDGGIPLDSGAADTGAADAGNAVAVRFDHGVASGDPGTDRVIIWTRVTPEADGPVTVMWQVATDENFANLVVQGEGAADASRDYTVKVDAQGLTAATTYYYRFMVGETASTVGTTKTLPAGSPSVARFVVFSCSNYPAGYFHVYAEAARVQDVDAAIHLGDYIYEYDRRGYASADAAALGRQSIPDAELLTLEHYRARHAQYRTDPDLQALHAALPFIAVWDDHEIANDAYVGGAENHQDDEGPWQNRLDAALRAYAEWMPIRPPVDEDVASLQRTFAFGDLVNVIMADTRIVGRDRQVNLGAYFDASGNFDAAGYAAAIGDPTRTLLGEAQRDWLISQLQTTQTWKVLGQQVLMGTMELPAAVLPRDPSDPTSAPLTVGQFALLAQLAQIVARAQAGDPTLTQQELDLLAANRSFLEANQALLTQGFLPYNLDAWDGYPVERAAILQASLAARANLVVLAGDTHNAWANNLSLGTTPVGVEFATASVSSPGLEVALGLVAQPEPARAAAELEAGVGQLIPGLQYANIFERGFLTVTFTPGDVTAEWTFIDTVKERTYRIVTERNRTITVPAGANRIG